MFSSRATKASSKSKGQKILSESHEDPRISTSPTPKENLPSAYLLGCQCSPLKEGPSFIPCFLVWKGGSLFGQKIILSQQPKVPVELKASHDTEELAESESVWFPCFTQRLFNLFCNREKVCNPVCTPSSQLLCRCLPQTEGGDFTQRRCARQVNKISQAKQK